VHIHEVDAEHQEYSIFANPRFRAVFAGMVRDALVGRSYQG
jgi:hypothetical protein